MGFCQGLSTAKACQRRVPKLAGHRIALANLDWKIWGEMSGLAAKRSKEMKGVQFHSCVFDRGLS